MHIILSVRSNHHMACMMTPSIQTAMNELSNHDHSRFLTRTNHIVGRVDRLGKQGGRRGSQPCGYAGSGCSADDLGWRTDYLLWR